MVKTNVCWDVVQLSALRRFGELAYEPESEGCGEKLARDV